MLYVGPQHSEALCCTWALSNNIPIITYRKRCSFQNKTLRVGEYTMLNKIKHIILFTLFIMFCNWVISDSINWLSLIFIIFFMTIFLFVFQIRDESFRTFKIKDELIYILPFIIISTVIHILVPIGAMRNILLVSLSIIFVIIQLVMKKHKKNATSKSTK